MESKISEVKSREDIKNILCAQMALLADKSKDCAGSELHFNSQAVLGIGKYLKEQYFNSEE